MFDVEVDEPGHTHEVTVHAFRELVGADLVGDLGLTAGEGAGGCANRCIVDGRISTGLASPDVTMELDLDTAALITVWLSEDEPTEVDGHPGFPAQAPHVSSPIAQTWWITDLGPLEPATTYHVVLAATDEAGRTEYRTGSFTTITPVEMDGGLASPDGPAGCAAQCITTALVDPTHDGAGLHVETHTSSILDVWVSTGPTDTSGDEPTFGPDVDKAATTDGLDVTSWDATLPDLLADTTYHVIVRATDLTGGRSFRVGSFHTEHGPQFLVRFRAVVVLGDGDDSELWNPGELSFAWGVDGVVLGTRGEEKISLNNIVALPDDLTRTSFSFVDEGGLMPVLMANAFERDPDGLNKFCALGEGLQSDPGRDDACDLKWNVASSGLTSTAVFDRRAPLRRARLRRRRRRAVPGVRIAGRGRRPAPVRGHRVVRAPVTSRSRTEAAGRRLHGRDPRARRRPRPAAGPPARSAASSRAARRCVRPATTAPRRRWSPAAGRRRGSGPGSRRPRPRRRS